MLQLVNVTLDEHDVREEKLLETPADTSVTSYMYTNRHRHYTTIITATLNSNHIHKAYTQIAQNLVS